MNDSIFVSFALDFFIDPVCNPKCGGTLKMYIEGHLLPEPLRDGDALVAGERLFARWGEPATLLSRESRVATVATVSGESWVEVEDNAKGIIGETLAKLREIKSKYESLTPIPGQFVQVVML